MPRVKITIDQRAPEPPYLQLAGQLRDAIARGVYQPREPVPSIHELVEATGLAVGTIRKAVKVLADEGVIYTVPGRGTFVR